MFYKKTKFLFITFLLILSSCAKKEEMQMLDTSNHKVNELFTMIDNSIYGLKITSSMDKIYIVDGGELYVYDDSTKQTIELKSLSFVDDKKYDGFSDIEAKSYYDVFHTDFLQNMGNDIFYVSSYRNVEGEEKVILKQVSEDGSKVNDLYIFDSLPGNILMTDGYVLYNDMITQKSFVLDLTTLSSYPISLDRDLSVFSYLITNEKTYIIGIDDKTGNQYLVDFDFATLDSNVVDGPVNGYVNFGYDETILSYHYDDETLIYGDVKKINGEILHTFENKVLYTIDENYVYTGKFEDPQKYEIYTHGGTLEYSVEPPSGFEPHRVINPVTDLSVSGILGVFKNQLFVVGYKEGKVQYYLVDYVLNEWEMIFESEFLVEVNK